MPRNPLIGISQPHLGQWIGLGKMVTMFQRIVNPFDERFDTSGDIPSGRELA